MEEDVTFRGSNPILSQISMTLTTWRSLSAGTPSCGRNTPGSRGPATAP